jgi:hypothetical protein
MSNRLDKKSMKVGRCGTEHENGAIYFSCDSDLIFARVACYATGLRSGQSVKTVHVSLWQP